MSRYLTKSRFKLARECPTKLYYTGKDDKYANQKNEDSFLLALAEGGYQVGTLAQAYYPSGHSIETLDHNEALRQTEELLKQKNVIIFEAAFLYSSLFVRVDIAIKKGNELELVEVKSKSNDSRGVDSMLTQKNTIASGWRPYVEDVAFQKFVISNSRPDLDVYAYLMTVDKDRLCPSDGLNQKFKIITDCAGRKSVKMIDKLTAEELENWILRRDNVDELCEMIFKEKHQSPDPAAGDLDFVDLADSLAEYYERDAKINPQISSACAKCEFRTAPDGKDAGLLSGFKECWHEVLGWSDADFAEPTLFDIGNLHISRKKILIDSRIFKIMEIDSSIIDKKESKKTGLSQSERQVLQIDKVHDKDNEFYIDKTNLKNEINSWKFPLHFIDFETAMAAIPFNKGRRPYEEIAFQFSHHIVFDDGRIEHHGDFIEVNPGVFPNYEFVRALKDELNSDDGSIFRYAAHENTYLQKIRLQILNENPPLPDGNDLVKFIDSITERKEGTGKNAINYTGARNMIDMCDLVKRFYYDPCMKGSTSIKKVLPAILKNSKYLQAKYSKPIYGSNNSVTGIKSLNYKDKVWLVIENSSVKDPYKQVRKLFKDAPEGIVLLTDDEEINQGGAAAMAYYHLQSEDMSAYEREDLKNALLEYCELDTFAMVMIYEGWCDLLLL